jgi:hypothetical protein
MSSIISFHRFRLAAAFILLALTTYAGTPLICHPYLIGSAQSLPGSDGDWKGVNPAYDRTHLVRDTLALLTPKTPIIVRMETLRRAAIYATAGMRGWGDKSGFNTEDRANTSALLEELRARADHARGDDEALALFDVGFFTETLRQTGVDRSLNGYDILLKARALRGEDPDMEFALALASSWPKRPERDQHLARARALAKPGSLLASNLGTHFSGS